MSKSKAQYTFKAYHRPFSRPLKTANGVWETRSGWLIAKNDADSQFGEICPLPSPKSEGTHPTGFSNEFAFAQWAARENEESFSQSTRTAALINLDPTAPSHINSLHQQGFTHCKIKLGVDAPADEWEKLKALLGDLPDNFLIRLDPNRAWSLKDWAFWKPKLENYQSRIQFIEEPFSKTVRNSTILEVTRASPIDFALDESLSSGLQFWADSAWPGYWVIKPSLMGNPETWMDQLHHVNDKIILSSAFETAIGLSALLKLAARLPIKTVHGLGTQAWFDDQWGIEQVGPVLLPPKPEYLQNIWNSI